MPPNSSGDNRPRPVGRAAQEVSSLDFNNLLAAPLIAVINAQAEAARTTVDFIKSVGFTTDQKGKETINNIEFNYQKKIENNLITDDSPTPTHDFVDTKLQVPLLTMLPIPYIRVEEVDVAFQVKINSVSTRNKMNSFNGSFEGEIGGESSRNEREKKKKNSSVQRKYNFNTSIAHRRTDRKGSSINKSYAMDVKIKAVQEDMPAGLETLLGILEDQIGTPPAKAS